VTDLKSVEIPTLDDNGDAEVARLIHQAATDAGESRPFMEPKTAAPKRGRGRPKKEQAESADTAAPGAEQAGPPPDPALGAKKVARATWSGVSGFLVKWTKVPEVAMTPEELDQMSDIWGEVAYKHLPGIMEKWGLEIAAITITAGVGFRMQAVLEKEVERRKAEQAKEVKSEQAKEKSK
jgi:hypothetical protein